MQIISSGGFIQKTMSRGSQLPKTKIYKSYINEIFGEKSGNVKVKGLLDSESQEEYESEWKRLENIWLNREKGSDKFVSYLRKNKK